MGAKIIDWPAADLRERFPDTRGYAAGTSSSPADAGKSVGTDRPIGGQQFLIGRCDGPLLTGGNPVGHRRQQFGGVTRRLTLLAASRSSH